MTCLSRISLHSEKLGTETETHKTPRGRLNKSLPCKRNKSVTRLLSTICVDNEPIKRHLINDGSNLKKTATSLPTLVFIYLMTQQNFALTLKVCTYILPPCEPLHYTHYFAQKMGVSNYIWTLKTF